MAIKREVEDSDGSLGLSAKRPRVFMDAVVIESIGIGIADSLDVKKADNEKLAKLKNPKIKKKKTDCDLGPDILCNRLRPIGLDIYPITLDKAIQDAPVSREYISHHYGGDPQSTFPRIGQSFIEKHGFSDFMFLHLNYQPHAPAIPGAPGLFFDTDLKPAGPWPKVQRVFSRIASACWLYMGQYQLQPDRSLTKEEWASMTPKVRNTWAGTLSTKAWGWFTRLRISLRRRLEREPTLDEVHTEADANEGTNKYFDVTVEDIGRAFLRGEETIIVWRMKCIAYDAGFQRALVEKWPDWTPRPKGKGRGKGKGKARKAPAAKAKARSPSHHSDTDEADDFLDHPNDSDENIEEIMYAHPGTRSRPTR